MEERVTIRQVAIKNGLIVGLIGIVINTINFMFGLYEDTTTTVIISVLSLAISVYFIVMAHKAYKEGNNGFMTYGQGLGIGTLLSLVSGIIAGVYQVAYSNLVDNSMQEYQQQQQVDAMLERGMTQAQIDTYMESSFAQLFQNPIVLVLITVIAATFFGFILSLIISAVTKKTDPSLEI